MLQQILEALQPAIGLAIEGLVGLFIGWLMMRLPPAVRSYVEANHRAALHSALVTAAQSVIDGDPETHPDVAIAKMSEHVRESVPDAIAALNPSAKVLENLARSKLRDVRSAVAGAFR